MFSVTRLLLNRASLRMLPFSMTAALPEKSTLLKREEANATELKTKIKYVKYLGPCVTKLLNYS